jgi:thiamine-phosphate diphosphorylase
VRPAWSLPPLLVLTDAGQAGPRGLLPVMAAAVEGGARAVLLREKHLPRRRRLDLAEALRDLLAPVQGVLVVASDGGIPADGVHLSSSDPAPRAGTPFGRSCHSAAEIAEAHREGCRWATLSPIFPTPSKPGYGPALGVQALASPPLPVWALGGVEPGNAASCVAAGAAGVAVMGAVMRAEDPAAMVHRLNRALQDGQA